MHVSRRSRTWLIGIISVVVILLIAARFYLNIWLLEHVNHVLAHLNGYQGSAQNIAVDLYRGAYRIQNLRIDKKEGAIPTPFIAIEQTDFSIQWRALLHGRIVSDAMLTRPVINFAVNESVRQTGVEQDWSKPIKELMPIDINHVYFRNGRLTYQDFSSTPRVNIYMHHMEGEVQNLRNVVDKTQKLPATIRVSGDSIGGGKLTIKGRMSILKEVPDMDLLVQLEHVHLPALNDYSNAYASFDFKDGDFSMYSEFIVNDNQVSGYIKPIATHIQILDLRKAENPIKVAWESIVAAVVTFFTNQTHDQFATKVELQGSFQNVNGNTWSTIAGILHNAFISALKRGFDETGESGIRVQQ